MFTCQSAGQIFALDLTCATSQTHINTLHLTHFQLPSKKKTYLVDEAAHLRHADNLLLGALLLEAGEVVGGEDEEALLPAVEEEPILLLLPEDALLRGGALLHQRDGEGKFGGSCSCGGGVCPGRRGRRVRNGSCAVAIAIVVIVVVAFCGCRQSTTTQGITGLQTRAVGGFT